MRARERKRKQLGVVIEMPSESAAGSIVASTRKSLVDAGRWGTPPGDLAMVLASRLESASGDTGASLASVSKEFRAAFAEALKDAPRADDGVDELRARRAKRLGIGG